MGARVEALPLLDMPPPAAVASARRLLVALGAMAPEGEQQLTPAGRAMAAFGTIPASPACCCGPGSWNPRV